jgi:lipoprotein Spr
MKTNYAAGARALVGVRFRPQGRDPRFGLDCVGLVLTTFGIPAEAVRRNYRLRGDHRKEIGRRIGHWFQRVSKSPRRSGDLMLLRVASEQFHFAISTERGFVHADARLERVVETPGEPRWPVIGIFRKRSASKG